MLRGVIDMLLNASEMMLCRWSHISWEPAKHSSDSAACWEYWHTQWLTSNDIHTSLVYFYTINRPPHALRCPCSVQRDMNVFDECCSRALTQNNMWDEEMEQNRIPIKHKTPNNIWMWIIKYKIKTYISAIDINTNQRFSYHLTDENWYSNLAFSNLVCYKQILECFWWEDL